LEDGEKLGKLFKMVRRSWAGRVGYTPIAMREIPDFSII
jgi:hypothetical protein